MPYFNYYCYYYSLIEIDLLLLYIIYYCIILLYAYYIIIILYNFFNTNLIEKFNK